MRDQDLASRNGLARPEGYIVCMRIKDRDYGYGYGWGWGISADSGRNIETKGLGAGRTMRGLLPVK